MEMGTLVPRGSKETKRANMVSEKIREREREKGNLQDRSTSKSMLSLYRVESSFKFAVVSSSSSSTNNGCGIGGIAVLRMPPSDRRGSPVSVVTALASDGVGRRPSLLASTASPPLIDAVGGRLGLRASPELGFLSLLFVLSAVAGSFLSLAIVSIPTMNAFRKLAISMNKLSRVVSEEVPGTLSSLKLSGLEIDDLTQQLNSIRIPGSKHARDGRPTKSDSRRTQNLSPMD